MCHCLAHRDAYNAGILHRDFSPSNVIIDDNGEGWLIDWDLLKPVSLSVQPPRCAARMVSNNDLLAAIQL